MTEDTPVEPGDIILEYVFDGDKVADKPHYICMYVGDQRELVLLTRPGRPRVLQVVDMPAPYYDLDDHPTYVCYKLIGESD